MQVVASSPALRSAKVARTSAFILLSTLLFCPSAIAKSPAWSGAFDLRGIPGAVNSLAVGSDGSLYISGNFTRAGNIFASYIVSFKGDQWSPLGSGLQHGAFIAPAYALLIDNNGDLLAGGSFDHAGGTPAKNIARWDGVSWHALGGGLSGDVYAIVQAQDGTIYAGGTFPGGVARWDGINWQTLGRGLFGDGGQNIVFSLDVADDGSLVAGGRFQTTSFSPTSNLAVWDGTVWKSFGPPLPTVVRAIGRDNAGPYIATETRLIALREGAWLELFQLNGDIITMSRDGRSPLIIGGSFTGDGSHSFKGVAQWDGVAISELGAGLAQFPFGAIVNGVARSDDASVFVGGEFTSANQNVAYNVAAWTNAGWTSLGSGNGLNGAVYSIAPDKVGRPIVGGTFTIAGDQYAAVARWEIDHWAPLATQINGSVFSIATDDKDRIYVGGDFTIVDDVPAEDLAVHDASGWHSLGNAENGVVFAVAKDPRHNDVLYAGGTFRRIGGVTANMVAKWDGTQWSALPGLSGGTVRALAVAPNGDLYAGGDFGASTPFYVSHFARWTGTTWELVGAHEIRGLVRTIKIDRAGVVWVGGNFPSTRTWPANNIARWDGVAWTGLGDGVRGEVFDIALGSGGNLYVTGAFWYAGNDLSSPFNRIAKWNGSNWSRVGSGTDNVPYAVAVDGDGSVWAGGVLTSAGDKFASYISMRQPPELCSARPKRQCEEVVGASISLRNRTNNRKDMLDISLRTPLSQAHPIDNLESGTWLGVCVYARQGGKYATLADAVVEPGAGWAMQTAKWTFADGSRTIDGVRRVTIDWSDSATLRVRLQAKGDRLKLGPPQNIYGYADPAQPLKIQVRASTGQCWNGSLPAATWTANTGVALRASNN